MDKQHSFVNYFVMWGAILQGRCPGLVPKFGSSSIWISTNELAPIAIKAADDCKITLNWKNFSLNQILMKKLPRKKIYLNKLGKVSIACSLPFIAFGDHYAVIEHSCRCHYIDEVDDYPILRSKTEIDYNYLEAWKFSEVATIINFSLAEDGSFLDFGQKTELSYYWDSFIKKFWYLAKHLNNVFAGCAFAIDYLIRGLGEKNVPKKDVYHMISRSFAYLFTFEPELFDSSMQSWETFYKKHKNLKFDWKEYIFDAINRIPFDFASRKAGELIDSSFDVDDIDLFEKSFTSKLVTSCKQKQVYQLSLSSKLQTRKLRHHVNDKFLQYINLQHWTFPPEFSLVIVHSSLIYPRIMDRSNWKYIPQWIERKKETS
jgi:hypothetical protein